MSITPRTECDDRNDKNFPVEHPSVEQRTQTLPCVPKRSRITVLSVMLVSAVTLACSGCIVSASSTVPKRSAGDTKQVSASETGAAQNSQVGTLITTLKDSAGLLNPSFSPDGQIIVSSTGDSRVKLWKRDGTLITTLEGLERDGIENISFSPDGQTIAASSGLDALKLWKRDGTVLTTLKRKYIGISSRFSPDGQTLISGGVDSQNKGVIQLWKRDGTLIKTLKENSAGVSAVNFSPDGQLIVSGNADGIIKLWKPDGTLITTVTAHKEGGFLGATVVKDMSFSPDGQMFASIGFGNTIKLWRRDGTLITTLKDEGVVTSIQFSPNGQTLPAAQGYVLASGSWTTGAITLWKPDGMRIKTWRGDVQSVDSVSFSPDGQVLVTGGAENTVKLWKVN